MIKVKFDFFVFTNLGCSLSLTHTHTHSFSIIDVGSEGPQGSSSPLFIPLIFQWFSAVSCSPYPSPPLLFPRLSFHPSNLCLSSCPPIYMPAGPHPFNVLTEWWWRWGGVTSKPLMAAALLFHLFCFALFLRVAVSASVCQCKSPLPQTLRHTLSHHVAIITHTHTNAPPHPPETFIPAYLGPSPDVKCLPGWWRW